MANILDRTFGCEFEFSTPLSEMKDIVKQVIKRTYGEKWLKISKSNDDTSNNFNHWHLKKEPSSETELCTPISTAKDLPKIKRVISLLSKEGIKVTSDDSLHVHIWAGDASQKAVLAAWIRYESVIKSCFPKNRHQKSLAYNKPILEYKGFTKNVASFLMKAIEANELTHHLVNIEHFRGRKTVEFRISEGTLDPLHVYCWVKTCLYFVNHIKREDPFDVLCSPVNTKTLNDFIKEFGIKDKKVVQWLKERKVHSE